MQIKRMQRVRLLAAAVVLALAATGLSGCGSSADLSGLSSTKLLQKASDQVKAQKYITISGKIAQSSTQTGLDLKYAGKDSSGSITLNGAQLQLETVDGKSYFKPSDAFWKMQMGAQANTIIKLINGRWIVADPQEQSFSQLIELANRDFITKSILNPTSKVTKGKEKTVDGVDCLSLLTKDGTLYLDKSDARPIQIVGTGKGGSGTANFTYVKVSTPTAPAQADQVDLAKLMGG